MVNNVNIAYDTSNDMSANVRERAFCISHTLNPIFFNIKNHLCNINARTNSSLGDFSASVRMPASIASAVPLRPIF